MIAPDFDLARLLGGQLARDIFRIREIAADPIGAILALSNHDAVLVDDPNDAAGGKPLHPKRVLEKLELGADGENGAQLSLLIFDRKTDGEHPLSGQMGADDFADRDPLARHDVLEKYAVVGIGTTVAGNRRRSDVGSIERVEQD